MFAKFALFVAASMAVLAAAAPSHIATRDGSCNSGSVQCCNSVQKSNSDSASLLHALIGIDAADVTGLIGLTCSPGTLVGAGATSCSSQSVCCSNNHYNGLVVVGCTPINVNL